MHISKALIISLLLVFPVMILAQKSKPWNLGTGSDLCINDSLYSSLCVREKEFVTGSELVSCPVGIQRSSENDVRKRYAFEWVVKYNNIYIRNANGIIYEGMNEFGFSASLLFLENTQLPHKERELIPIGTSLLVNFFIDHFKCIDTALLAVWDIRVFDDLGLKEGWPFRLILHDSTGATAYIEYTGGRRSVYTPGPPAFIVEGPDYTRLIKLEHLSNSEPETLTEILYLDIVMPMKASVSGNPISWLLKYYIKEFEGKEYYTFFRYHRDKELVIMTPANDEVVLNFNDIEFTPGKEESTRFF